MNKKFVYEITFFAPPPEKTLGGFGLEVEVDLDFANRARELKMDERTLQRFQEQGLTTINRFFRLNEDSRVRPTFKFVDDSWLLHYVDVPGNACGLGLDREGRDFFYGRSTQIHSLRSDNARYESFNVDTVIQASCLLSLITYWANQANAKIYPSFQPL